MKNFFEIFTMLNFVEHYLVLVVVVKEVKLIKARHGVKLMMVNLPGVIIAL